MKRPRKKKPTMNGNNGKDNKRGRILRFERDSSFFAKRGDAKRAQNDPVSAISLYYTALEHDPTDLDTRLAAAQVLTDMARFNDSNRMLIPYMHEDAEFCKEAYCIVGFNMLGLGEYDGARLCFDRFFTLTDEISERTDAILDAIEFLEEDEGRSPLLSDAAVIERQANVKEAFKAVDTGDFDRAERQLKLLHARYPQDEEILYKLALACLCRMQYKDCDAYLDELLSVNGSNWGALGMKLMCAKALKNELETTRLTRKLGKCDSEDPETLLKVNGSLYECGAFEQALEVAKRLVRLLPYDTVSNHRMGAALMALGEYSKAAEVYDKLARLDRRDRIAKFYRAGCLEAANDPACEFAKLPVMVQYQIPLPAIIDDVRRLMKNSKELKVEELVERWRDDPDYRDLVRWTFTLHEFNTSRAVISLLYLLGDEMAEKILREALADIDVSDPIKNETLAALKRMDAEEPFFAISEGRLLEGRVNIVDLSDVSVPKGYRDIIKRISENAPENANPEVLSVASTLAERFIMCSVGNFRQLSDQQSSAISAAMEFLACERCGVLVPEDLLERYGVTERRLSNAIDRIIKVFMDNDLTTQDNDNGGA